MPTNDDKNTNSTQNATEPQGQSAEGATSVDDQTGKNAEPEPSDSNLPKSQKELDDLFERKLQKEKKKWEKSLSKPDAKTEGTPADDTVADETLKNENARLKSELQESRAQNAAAKLGFKADVIDDAVYLAMRNADKNNDGDFDDEDIKTELSAVLKKHPEWKADAGNNAGFRRVGAPDPKRSAEAAKPTAQKPWNKFNH